MIIELYFVYIIFVIYIDLRVKNMKEIEDELLLWIFFMMMMLFFYFIE